MQNKEMVISAANPDDDFELRKLNDWIAGQGLVVRPIEKPFHDVKGQRQSATLILAILATPAVVAFAKKLGDAVIEWVRVSQPKTAITLEYDGRKITLDTNQLKTADARAVTAQIQSVLPPPATLPSSAPSGGETGGGD